MVDLEKIKENCAKYGKKRKKLDEEIERDYIEYQEIIRHIYVGLLMTGLERAKKQKYIGFLILAVAIVIGMLMLILGGMNESGTMIAVGLAILAAGIVAGAILINKAGNLEMDYKVKADTFKIEINKVITGLIP